MRFRIFVLTAYIGLLLLLMSCTTNTTVLATPDVTADSLPNESVRLDLPQDTTVIASGTVYSARQAELIWQTSGIIEAVSVEVGNPVLAGDVLASLEFESLPTVVILAEKQYSDALDSMDELDASYDQVAVAEAAYDVAIAFSALDNAEQKYRSFINSFNQNQMDLAWAKVIAREDVLDELEENLEDLEIFIKNHPRAAGDSNIQDWLDTLELAVAQAEYDCEEALYDYEDLLDGPNPVDVNRAFASINLAQENLADAQETYASLLEGPTPDEIAAVQAQIDSALAEFALREIAAPFDGVVTSIDAQVGDVVTEGDTSFRIDDLSALYIDVEISEVDIHHLSVGQTVIINLNAVEGRRYTGAITRLDPVGKNLQGLITFITEVYIVDADGWVKPGMSAVVQITATDL